LPHANWRATPVTRIGADGDRRPPLVGRQSRPRASQAGDALTIVTDDSAGGYQAVSDAIPIPPNTSPAVRLQGSVDKGAIAVGVLDGTEQRWLASRTYHAGPIDDALVVEPGGSRAMTLVISAAGAPPPSQVTLVGVDVVMSADDGDAGPAI
jgi:hypothetical protein